MKPLIVLLVLLLAPALVAEQRAETAIHPGRADSAAADPDGPEPFACLTLPVPAGLTGGWARRRAAPASAWTEGRKRLLLVRVDFSDLPGAPFTPERGTNLLTELDAFFTEMSYGKAGFQAAGSGSDFTSVLRMPRTAALYGLLDPSQLRNDALAAARNTGFDPARYDLDVICFGNVSGFKFTGFAYVGVRGAWVKNAFTHCGPIAHELGHNLGLNHANLWDTGGYSILGPGREVEYGDTSDTMSLNTGTSRHFNARTKRLLDWLTDEQVATPQASGRLRLFAHDIAAPAAGPRAIRIARDPRTNYWLEFRARHTNSPTSGSSLALRWANATNRPTLLLDTTPGSPPGARDAFLRPGHTFSDPALGLHVTVLGRTNTEPPALDLDLQFGTFPGNRPPSASIRPSEVQVAPGQSVAFTVDASDPDADGLSYGWDTFDETAHPDAPGLTRSFTTAGEHLVDCVVSDRRGGTTRVRSIVRVGNPGGARLAGTVLRNGQPLDGARLVTAAGRVTVTDRDGRYLIPGLTNGPQSLTPYLAGHAFVPRRAEAVITGADLTLPPFTAHAYSDLESVDLQSAAAAWRYLDNGTDPGAAWRTNSFQDAAWKSGPAPLGYGMPGLGTTVSFGPNPNGKWVTTFFRRSFTVDDPSAWLALILHLQRDDGAVAYLNGIEVARSNLKEDAFNFLTFALEDVSGAAETDWFQFEINPALLRPGTNLLAVEVHQFTNTTPDCRFDARLEGLRLPTAPPPPPVMEFALAGDTLTICLRGRAGSRFRIETSPDLKSWSPGATVLLDAAGSACIEVALPGGDAARFFRAIEAR